MTLVNAAAPFEVPRSDHAYKWSIRLVWATGLYIAGAFCFWPGSFLTLSQMYGTKFAVNVPILLTLGIFSAGLIYGRSEPTRYAISMLTQRWRLYTPVFFFFFLGLTAFSTYKTAIPSVVPFYADPWLASLDEWLHGMQPWRLAHWYDSDTLGFIIFESYKKLWFGQWFGTVLFVAMWPRYIERIRYLWALLLTFAIVGSMLAMGLSSVGPIFYDSILGGNRFHGLQVALNNQEYSYLIREYSDYLLALYRANKTDLGSGISAMPSVHVALVVLNAYFLSSLNRWLGAVGWTYAAFILFSSVYTGMHYATDGYVSIAVVSLIWWLTGRFILRSDSAASANA
jgi:membrane-associated phospholipid phosphatase